MSVRIHHGGHKEDFKAPLRLSLRPPWFNVSSVLILTALLTSTIAAQNQTRQPLPPEKRIHYKIQLALNYENRTYTGSERVRWVNRGDHPTSTLFFHLYPNVRIPGYLPPTEKSLTGQAISDEPRLDISEVRTAGSSTSLQFALDDQET